jgi:hypothetical protein
MCGLGLLGAVSIVLRAMRLSQSVKELRWFARICTASGITVNYQHVEPPGMMPREMFSSVIYLYRPAPKYDVD